MSGKGLAPCPFCGGQPRMMPRFDLGGRWRVYCTEPDCDIGGPYRVDDEEAAEAWNTRSDAYADWLNANPDEIGML